MELPVKCHLKIEFAQCEQVHKHLSLVKSIGRSARDSIQVHLFSGHGIEFISNNHVCRDK